MCVRDDCFSPGEKRTVRLRTPIEKLPLSVDPHSCVAPQTSLPNTLCGQVSDWCTMNCWGGGGVERKEIDGFGTLS